MAMIPGVDILRTARAPTGQVGATPTAAIPVGAWIMAVRIGTHWKYASLNVNIPGQGYRSARQHVQNYVNAFRARNAAAQLQGLDEITKDDLYIKSDPYGSLMQSTEQQTLSEWQRDEQALEAVFGDYYGKDDPDDS